MVLGTALAVVLAVGAVALAASTSFSGLEGRVYAQNIGGDVCLNMSAERDSALVQTLDLKQKSHVVVDFTYQIGSLTSDEEAKLGIFLDGQSDFEWGIAGNEISRTSGTLTWSFSDVPAGTHTISAEGRLEGGDESAEISNCALTTALLIPAP